MQGELVAAEKLRSFIGRIERLEEEKEAAANDQKVVYAEAKSEGFDAKIIRKIVALRKQDPRQRAEEAELLELYLSAIEGKAADSAAA